MKMGQEQRWRIDPDRFFEELGGTDVDGVHRTAVDHDLMGDTVLAIEQDQPQFFLVEGIKGYKNVVEQVLVGVRRGAQHDLFAHGTHKAACTGSVFRSAKTELIVNVRGIAPRSKIKRQLVTFRSG